jgi:membrane protease YdiL (CAAX protease family)
MSLTTLTASWWGAGRARAAPSALGLLYWFASLVLAANAVAIPFQSPARYVAGALTMLAGSLLLGARFGLGLAPVHRPWRTALCAAVPLPIMALAIAVLALVGVVDSFGSLPSPRLQLTPLLVTAVLTPAAEELACRGWLWEGLRARHSVWFTGALTCVLFALLHVGTPWYRPLAVLPVAIGLTLTRASGRSVYPCFLLHALWNVMVMVA